MDIQSENPFEDIFLFESGFARNIVLNSVVNNMKKPILTIICLILQVHCSMSDFAKGNVAINLGLNLYISYKCHILNLNFIYIRLIFHH